MSKPVVIDIGTRLTMTGFAGEDFPRYVWPTVVGYPINDTMIDSDAARDFRVGQEAFDSLSQRLVYPLKAGNIEDWDAMEDILTFCFDSLGIDPHGSQVLITEPPFNSPEKKLLLTQLLFHDFGVSRLYIALRQVLALYAVKKASGTVFDFEPDYACIIPVYDYFAIPHAMEILNPPVTEGLELSYLAVRLVSAINKTDNAIHDLLYGTIILTGSSTTTSQFKTNLQKEITERIPSGREFSIVDVPERLYLPWIGGSMLSNLPSFREAWVSSSEFSEKGSDVFNRDI